MAFSRARSTRAVHRAALRIARTVALLGLLVGCDGSDRPVRIVLITLDTLRHDAFHGTPERPSPMPATAAFASRGQVFERFYAATTTTQPTHATLLTGLHPWLHGVQRNGALLDPQLHTIPEQLTAAGFETAAVVASYPLRASFGFDQGFQSYVEDFSVSVNQAHWEGEPLRAGGFYSQADQITRQALESLDRLQGDKQFLWVHYYDAHEPYGDSATDDGETVLLRSLLQACRIRAPDVPELVASAQDRYSADVAALDTALGRLFARLEADGERWRTHVIVTSDHGESFGEDGALGHGKRLTQEQVLVPTFLVSPDLQPARRDDVAGSIDLAATLLSFAGLDDSSVAGRDLTLPPATGQPHSAFGMRRTFLEPFVDFRTDGTLVRESGPRFYAVVDGVLHTGTAGEIFEADLPDRPAKQKTATRISALFEVFATELEDSELIETTDPEALRSLEALGYVR